jgi:RNA polymerase sigma factor (sigma-70 family)
VTAPVAPWDLLRELAPQVLGAVVRRYGHFDLCEDAVQEALLAASVQWPRDGPPASPRAWLITVASRRLADQLRAESARRDREATAALDPAATSPAPDPAGELGQDQDDTLTVLFLCCHPALSGPSQIALTLRAVGGLTTAEIARAFLVPEATMAQRISRAKQSIKAAGARFSLPGPGEWDGRLDAEAIRLARAVRRLLPDDGEVTGLLALMLLTEARRPARTGPGGALIPLAEQDRSRWDRAAIAEGTALIAGALAAAPLGPYQVQAAIAAVHAEAGTAGDTDWPQVAALYGVLDRIAPGPMVTLNRAVAVAMAQGPHAGLDLLATLDADGRLAGHHRLAAVRAHLLEQAGQPAAARDAYTEAARLTTSLPEQRYLTARAARLPDRKD